MIEKELLKIYESEEYVEILKKHGKEFFRYYLPEVFPPEGGRFLDVGCGTGYAVRKVAGKGFGSVGVDISRTCIRRARELSSRHENATFLVADTRNLPFGNESFSVVGCFDLIEHLYEPETCIREMVRVLEPDGKIVIGCPNLRRVVRVLGPLEPSLATVRNALRLAENALKVQAGVELKPEYNPNRNDPHTHITNPPYLLQVLRRNGIDIRIFSSFGWRAKTEFRRAVQIFLNKIPIVRHYGDGIIIIGKKLG